MAQLRLLPPDQFDFRNPDDWPRWKRRFQQFREASSLTEDSAKKQVNTLLYCLGEEAEAVLSSTTITAEERDVYDTVVSKFDSFFQVRRNVIFERARFNKRDQLPGETVEQYIMELYKLVEYCSYGELKDEMIRDRLVVGILDSALSQRLQLDATLTLEKAKKLVRQREAVGEQNQLLRETEPSTRPSTSVDPTRKWPAGMTTVDDVLGAVRETHSHGPDEGRNAVSSSISRMRKRAREETLPVTQIYDQEVQRISTYTNMEEVAAKLPTFPSLKSSLYRNHRVRLPVLPQSREDVVFEGEWAQTMSGAPFLLASEGAEDKIVIFATRDNLELLSAADTVYMDGTFRVCPRLFYQVFTLHIFRHGQQFPVVYFLLPRKARETYNKAFTMLKEAAQNFGLDIVGGRSSWRPELDQSQENDTTWRQTGA